MRRNLTLAGLVLVCFLLQTTVFRSLEIASVAPNFLLILTVSFGFMQGKKQGLVLGFFCGLLIDIFYGDLFGFYALLYMYVGFVCGFLCRVFFDEDIKVPLVLVGIADIAYNVVLYFFLFLTRGRLGFFGYLRSVIIPEMLYTVLVTIVLYRIFYGINQALIKTEVRGKQSLWLKN